MVLLKYTLNSTYAIRITFQTLFLSKNNSKNSFLRNYGIFYYGRETTPFTGIAYNCKGQWRTYEGGVYEKRQYIGKLTDYVWGEKDNPDKHLCQNWTEDAFVCVEGGEKEFDRKEWDSLFRCP